MILEYSKNYHCSFTTKFRTSRTALQPHRDIRTCVFARVQRTDNHSRVRQEVCHYLTASTLSNTAALHAASLTEGAHIFVSVHILVVFRGVLAYGCLIVGSSVHSMQFLSFLSPYLVSFSHYFLHFSLFSAEVGQFEVYLTQLLVVVGELAEHLVPLLLVHLQLSEGLLVRLTQLLVCNSDLRYLAALFDHLFVQALLFLT